MGDTPTGRRMSGVFFVFLSLGILFAGFGFAPSPELDDSAYPVGPAEPAPSPDGTRLAFSWAGDLWTVSAEGGIASRLTDGPAEDERPVWSPNGRTIAFARREGERRDVWILDLASGGQRQLTRHDAPESPTAFSSDGEVVFFHGGREDGVAVFQVPAKGGEIERLLPAPSRDAVLTSAGDLLFVRGEDPWWRRGGGAPSNCDLWVRRQDGAVRRLTTFSGPDLWPIATKGGRYVYYVSEESYQRNLWRLDVTNGQREQITAHRDEGVLFPRASADGRWIFYEHGGRIWKLELSDPGSGARGNPGRDPDRDPARSPDRTSDRNSIRSPEPTVEHVPTPVPIYFPERDRAEAPVIREWTSDARRLVVNGSMLYAEIGGDVFQGPVPSFALDGLDSGPAASARGDAQEFVSSDRDTLQLSPVASGGFFEEGLVLGADGTSGWVVSDRSGSRDLYRVDAAAIDAGAASTTTNVDRDRGRADSDATTGSRLQPYRQDRSDLVHPVLSPDGRYLAYVKRFDGAQLRLGDPEGGRDVEVARAVDISEPTFSPDGRWIAFTAMDETGNRDVFVASLFGSGVFDVTLHPALDRSPRFSPDGRWLFFLSDRAGSLDLWGLQLRTSFETEGASEEGAETEKQAEKEAEKETEKETAGALVAIDFDGIAFRSVQLSALLGDETTYDVGSDGRIAVIGSALGSQDLYLIAEPGADPVLATRGIDLAHVVLEGDDVWLLDARGRIRFAKGSAVARSSAVPLVEFLPTIELPFHAAATHDPRDERQSVVDRAWSELRDGFYQETLHLANWSDVRDRVRERIPGVRTRGELERLLLEMSGELNASHLGVGTPSHDPVGMLGVTVYSDDGRVRVRSVVPDGPADALGIAPGDQIFSVHGSLVDGAKALEVAAPLVAGEPVDLVWLNRKGEERRGTTRTASAETIRALRFSQDERVRSEWVRKETKGKIAYVALPTIDRESLHELRRQVELVQPKSEAIILDLRDNIGGDLPEEFLRQLDRTPLVARQPRGELRRPVPAPITRSPLAVLVGRRTGSAAEVVARGLAEDGRAVLVGETTAGSVIGADEIELGMGLRFRIPRVGWYTLQGENLEGRGVSPDVEVETSPFGAYLGSGEGFGTPAEPGVFVEKRPPGYDSDDLVLERAIELLEDRLRRR